MIMVLGRREMSVGRLMLSVFLPSSVMLLLYAGALNFRDTIPPLLSFLIICIFALLPIELYGILRASKNEYGKYSLKSALIYNNKMAPKKLLLTAFALFCIAGATAVLVGNIETRFMTSTVFKFVPEYFRIEDFVNQTTLYSSTMILLTCVLYVFSNVFVLPIVEELYFRGYLMPRIERFGKLTPIIIAVLFSLYHFWAPWAIAMRILAIFPYTYSVWKNKNIHIGILVHCAINLVSSLSMILMVYGI
jgi:membrane protease YdiL (CAAX protease family)